MNCRDIDEILASANGPAEIPKSAREHIDACGNCQALLTATRTEIVDELDPLVLEAVRRPILSNLTRVRPMPSTTALAAAFLAILAGAALLGAKVFGVNGFGVLSPLQRIVIFGVLAMLALLAAFAIARDMRPGLATIRGSIVFAVAIGAAEGVFFALFHDYTMGRFIRWGMGCLTAGLVCAIPVAVLVAVLVRRGYVTAPVSTGAAVGALAGLTGLTMLELHCPILTVPHVAIWHVGVVVVCVGVGALAGWVGRLK